MMETAVSISSIATSILSIIDLSTQVLDDNVTSLLPQYDSDDSDNHDILRIRQYANLVCVVNISNL